MKSKVYKDEQVVKILRAAEESGNIRETCRKHGVTEQTFYRWRKKFSGMEVSDVKNLKKLESENARLKRLLAEREMEIDIINEVFKKNGLPQIERKSPRIS